MILSADISIHYKEWRVRLPYLHHILYSILFILFYEIIIIWRSADVTIHSISAEDGGYIYHVSPDLAQAGGYYTSFGGDAAAIWIAYSIDLTIEDSTVSFRKRRGLKGGGRGEEVSKKRCTRIWNMKIQGIIAGNGGTIEGGMYTNIKSLFSLF